MMNIKEALLAWCGLDLSKITTKCLLVLALALPSGLAQADVCSGDEGIEQIGTDQTSSWRLWNDDGLYQATLSSQEGEELLTFELDMDGPSTPEVLGWSLPPLYNDRIGLLHYYSGATATHFSAEITRYAVINLEKTELVAIMEASVYLAGSRYHEKEDGTYEEEAFSSCITTDLEWLPDRLNFTRGERSFTLMLFD